MNGGGYGNIEGQDDKNVVIDVNPEEYEDYEHEDEQRCDDFFRNFNLYFTLGMMSFFVFWGTLLFHIWPPSLYWPQQLLFWEEKDIDRERFNITRNYKDMTVTE